MSVNSLNISVGLNLAWVLAAIEASVAGHELIEPEYLFIGLCKLEDMATPTRLQKMGIPDDQIGPAQTEITALLRFFEQHKLDPKDLRREMRRRAGTGPTKGRQDINQTMHRSPRSRAIFDRAASLAGEDARKEVTVFHLLAALLEDSQNKMVVLLGEHQVDVAAVREAALKCDLPRSAPRRGVAEPSPMAQDSVLSRFGQDQTEEARAGKLNAVIGRKEEMLQMVRTLSRDTKNNPVLIGEPGVGKTAVVEGLAWRIAQGNVPEAVRGKRIIKVQMADLVAGTKHRGEFEARLQGLIYEVASAPDVILFIDEIHTLVGAGKGEGALDAANILKPALARGDLRCIGATTFAEYRKHIEKDPALERRFQPITINEPTPEATIDMLRQGIKPRLEKKHRVDITEDALAAAAKLSSRYLPDRRLPDKAIDLLDEACARVKITTLSISPHGQIADLNAPLDSVPAVTAETVAAVLAEWTGIPLEQLKQGERERLLCMAEALKERIIGQDEAVEAVAEVVLRARAGIKRAGRPVGVLLFLGPTGVGKTELAKATADFLFGSEKAMIRLDMSEFAERHLVARLVGSPPGYIGSEEEGQLTGALRAKPFSLVLIDEVEKAHPEVLNLFLQVFDDGRLTDAKGRTVDASNALFIMTSNLGSGQHHLGFRPQESEAQWEALMAEVKETLRPEFLNRIDRAVVFSPLRPEHITRIARGMLAHLRGRLEEKGLAFSVTDDALALLAHQGYEKEYGARPLRRIIEQLIENPLGGMLLRGEAREGHEIVIETEEDEIVIKVMSKETL